MANDIFVTVPRVYFNRPTFQMSNSGETYDEGWLRLIDADPYNSNLPSNAIIQRVDPDDWFKVVYDDSYTTGVSEHKFRFIGINGGYYDISQAIGERWRDIDGGLSDWSAVTSAGTIYYIIDRLTGYGWELANFIQDIGNSVATTIAAEIMNNSHGGYDDWYMPTMSQFYTIHWSQSYSFKYSASNNSIFKWTTTAPYYAVWSCSPRTLGSGQWLTLDLLTHRTLFADANTYLNYTGVRMRYHYK